MEDLVCKLKRVSTWVDGTEHKKLLLEAAERILELEGIVDNLVEEQIAEDLEQAKKDYDNDKYA